MSSRPADPGETVPTGWVRASHVARLLRCGYATVQDWVLQDLLPHRKIGKGRYLPIEAARELVRSWPCQICHAECLGPKGLADHLNSIHMFEGMVCAVNGWPIPYDPNVPWPCPDAGCARHAEPFDGGPALVRHLEEHVREREARGIGERRHPAPGGRRGRPLYRCKHRGCEIVCRPTRGAARGLCARHYKQGQLAGKFKRRQPKE